MAQSSCRSSGVGGSKARPHLERDGEVAQEQKELGEGGSRHVLGPIAGGMGCLAASFFASMRRNASRSEKSAPCSTLILEHREVLPKELQPSSW